MATVIDVSSWELDEDEKPAKVLATVKLASALVKGDIVTNVGVVKAARREGVFVIAAVRGTIWSIATGLGDVHEVDVVWHEAQQISVDRA